MSPPSAWIRRFTHALKSRGQVLDLACGDGRHTRLFAAAGHLVTAIDRDLQGVGDLVRDPNVRLIEADLEANLEVDRRSAWPVGDARFACVVVTNYLHRPLFPRILGAVDEGGMLLYETFAHGNERFGRPSNPDFLLAEDELLRIVEGQLAVVAFEQGLVRRAPNPAVVQRICAVRGGDRPWPLPE